MWEEWEFIFIPLNNTALHEIKRGDEDKDGLLSACACICIGPSLSRKKKKTNCPSVLLRNVERKEPSVIARIEALLLLEVLELHGHDVALGRDGGLDDGHVEEY
jgi:hypothetical protein